MIPVLLYTDTKRISDEQTTLSNIVPIYQAIYTAVKAAGITAPTLAEIDVLVQNAKKRSTADFVTDYVTNKLVSQVSPFVVNGVTLTSQAVKGMIAIPNTAAITTALQPVSGGQYQNIFIGESKASRLNLLSLAADVITAVADANAQITALFTYYTANDASTTIANQLQAVCDALNTFNGANSGIFASKIPTDEHNTFNNSYLGMQTSIPGIAYFNNSYVVSLPYMRRYEQLGTLNFNL
jgi:hypothetical protein